MARITLEMTNGGVQLAGLDWRKYKDDTTQK